MGAAGISSTAQTIAHLTAYQCRKQLYCCTETHDLPIRGTILPIGLFPGGVMYPLPPSGLPLGCIRDSTKQLKISSNGGLYLAVVACKFDEGRG